MTMGVWYDWHQKQERLLFRRVYTGSEIQPASYSIGIWDNSLEVERPGRETNTETRND